MTDIPWWITNPDSPEAAAAMAADLAENIGRKKLEEALDRAPDADPERLVQHPRLQAEIEAEVMRLTAQVAALSNRSLMYQGIRMGERGVWRYHPSEPATAAEHFQNIMDGVERESSTWYDIYFLATKIYPLMVAYGIEGADELYQQGNIAKTRASIPHLRRLLAQLEQPPAEESTIDNRTDVPEDEGTNPVLNQITNILGDVRDESVSLTDFHEKHAGKSRSELPTISGWNYVQKSGGVLVLMYTDEAQLQFVQSALSNKVSWSLGAGNEPILEILVPKNQ